MMREFAGGAIRLSQAEVARLTLHRPEVCNAVSRSMWAGLEEACRFVAASSEVRVLIVAGEGRHFCAGADISEFAEVFASPQSADRYNRLYERAEAALRDVPQPVIAAITGACVGGGLGLALAADLRFADETAFFAVTASRLGITYAAHDAARIVEQIGASRAKDMLFSARSVPACEALDWGLVDRLAPSGQLVASIDGYTQEIARRSPASLAASKTIINALLAPDAGLCTTLRPVYDRLFVGEDLREGRQAFLDKREPRFGVHSVRASVR